MHSLDGLGNLFFQRKPSVFRCLVLGLLLLLVRFPFLSDLPFSKPVFIYIVRSLRFILSPESAFYT